MKQLYYAIQIILHGRGSNVTKVISLSLGLTIGILLFSQIAFELSYEKCYPEPERLVLARYAMTNMVTGDKMGGDGNNNYDETVMVPVAGALAENMPNQVESATAIYPNSPYRVYKEDKLLEDAKYIFVDTCFFRTLGIPVLKGNQQDLAIPKTVFVSEHFARETFGDQDPIGKTLTFDKQRELTIRGIYKDMPENSMFQHDFVSSIYYNGGYEGWGSWKGNDIYCAILRLHHASDVDEVNRNIQKVIEKYTPSKWDNWKCDYNVIPLLDRYTDHPDVKKRLIILGFLGFAIFFVAIMNYILISVASMSKRAKAVGVHKCSGAGTGNIFAMFLIETGIIVLISLFISFFLIFNARSLIEDLLSVQLSSLFTVETLWVPLLTIFVLFLVAGILPGRMFSRVPVTQVFRRYTDGKKGWKRSLLFIQFTGVAFVLGLLLVTLLQYSLLMNRDMGIKVPGLVEAETWLPTETVEHFKDEVRRQPMVEGVTVSNHSILGQYWTRGLMGEGGNRIATLNMNYCDYNYPMVAGITITEGTTFQKDDDVLVNEELVRLMKWTDGAIGKKVDGLGTGTIVGVFRNVRNEGFYSEQPPIALIGMRTANHTFNVRLKEPYDDNLKKLNSFVEKTFPTVSLHFESIDSMLRDGYKSVSRFRNSVWITSCFILLIVIMGLIGYVNDETQRRSKEIAIRKVNGAEASHILHLLILDILYVSIPSVLIGMAVSYFAGKAWLEQFAEKIDLSPLLFIGVGFTVMIIIVFCVMLRAWRIANENPVKSIKSE